MSQVPRRSAQHAHYQKTKFWRWDDADERRSNLFREFIAPGSLVFDVGANAGGKSKIFLKLGARVVAFEPQDLCAAPLASALAEEEAFTLVRKALGASEARTQMLISEVSALSTLSREWIDAARRSGRLREWSWGATQWVDVTTLDRAIQAFGRPDFVNIDVEGFELEVLLGLSAPVPSLCLRFACEFLDRAWRCIDHLQSMCEATKFQIALGDDDEFDLARWVPASIARATLAELVDGNELASGSIFARMKSQQS